MTPRPIRALVLLLPFATACATPAPLWHTDESLKAEKIEMQVDGEGRALEVEYHVPAAAVPAGIHEAMNDLHPGGRITGAEKEYVGGELYWELSKDVGGRAVEAMFLPDGTLHSQELEISEAAVPPEVVAAVSRRMGGEVTVWEEIRDAAGRVLEHHAKVTLDGKRYKVVVGRGAVVTRVVREVPAEIEMPIE